jgi:type II secretory pathway component PulF
MIKKIKKFLNRLDSIGLESERNLFIENVSLLIASGIDISSSLAALKRETKSRPMKRIIGEIEEDINSGFSFWRALEKTKIFSPHIISLIKIGEESGRLESNLQVISEQEEKDREFKSKMHSAMMYPAFVLGLTLIIGIVVAWFILPRLSSVFSSLKLELPLITQLLIAFGNFLNENGVIFVPAFLFAIGLVVFFIFYFPKTKFIGQEILFHLPGTRKLTQQVELSRFGHMLGTLLDAGITINEALSSLIESSIFAPYRNFYKYLLKNIEEGNSFEKSFSNYKKLDNLIPASVQQMVINGEQSGFLSRVLLKIGGNYEKKIADTTKNLSVILEPVLLVIVWLGVVAVAMAVILPIYSLVGGFGEGVDKKQDVKVKSSPVIIQKEKKIDEISDFAKPINNLENNNILKIKESEEPISVFKSFSRESQVLGKVETGEEYSFDVKQEDWYRIILNNGEKVWIPAEFIILE